MLIQCNKQPDTFIDNILSSYARLYNNVDYMVKSHKIPSFDTLSEAKGKNVIRQEVYEYLDKLK